jgi:hypothetical protein
MFTNSNQHVKEVFLGGEEVYLLLILDIGTSWGWVVSITPWLHFTQGERTPCTHWIGGWVGPRVGLDRDATGKSPLSLLSNLDHPVAQSVVRHYTDWATPAHHVTTPTVILLRNCGCISICGVIQLVLWALYELLLQSTAWTQHEHKMRWLTRVVKRGGLFILL